MKVRIISKIQELNIIQIDWRNLFISEGRSVFQSFEFNYYAWKIELSKNKLNKLCVILLKTNQRVSAVLPLYIDSKKRLRFINDKHADFCDVLANEEFDVESILYKIRNKFKFNSIHFINLTEESFLYDLYKKKAWNNTFSKPFDKYSDLAVPAGDFPDNVLTYRSKQKTEFRRVKKRNADKIHHLLLKDDTDFPIIEICLLRERMIELGLRKADFLDENRLLLLKELYNSNRLLVSMVGDKNNIYAVSFILRNVNEYLFWIDMYDDTKMINIYNYILFMENISCKTSIKINFGRGAYDYKILNFKPDVKQLFAIYIFSNRFQMSVFLVIDKIIGILKLIYKENFKRKWYYRQYKKYMVKFINKLSK